MYIPILYVTRMAQNKNGSINSILHHGRVVDKNWVFLHFYTKWTSDVPVKKNTLVNDGDIKVIETEF